MTTRQLRPVFNRLPIRGYQDNPIADALTSFYDEKLVATGKLVEDFHLSLDPLTTSIDKLDWLASLVGMVAPYYDTGWAVPVKRKAIASANYIFQYRGTKLGLQKALAIHGFTYSIFTSKDLTLPFTFAADGSTNTFGVTSQGAFVTLPIAYPRNGYEFREARRAISMYTAVSTPILACYDKFYLGFSSIGDPLL
jgi:phage tail-like protein